MEGLIGRPRTSPLHGTYQVSRKFPRKLPKHLLSDEVWYHDCHSVDSSSVPGSAAGLYATHPPTQAAEDAAELQALQDNAYAAVTQPTMYLVLDRDPGRKAAIEMRLKLADVAVASLADAALADKWQTVRAALVSEPYAGGEVDPLAIYDMENRVTEFVVEINARMPRGLSSSRKALYELVGILQGRITIYLRNRADPRGGSGYVGVNQDIDLAVQQ